MKEILTYDQFKKVVPSETMIFVDQVLVLFNYHIKSFANLINGIATDDLHARALIIMLAAFNDSDLIKSGYMAKYDFKRNKIDIKIPENQEKKQFNVNKVFSDFSSYFCCYQNPKDYNGLLPSKLLVNCIKLYNNKIDRYELGVLSLFGENNEAYNFFVSIEAQHKKELSELKQEHWKNFQGNLNINIINYSETYGKIYNILLNAINNQNYNDEIITNLEEDVFTLCGFLSLFFYEQISSDGDKNLLSDRDSFVQILNDYGINIGSIEKTTKFSIRKSDVEKKSFDVFELIYSCDKFIRGGLNKDKKDEDITSIDIMKNLLCTDRDFNSSLVIERILAKSNCYIGMFNNLEQQIKDKKEEYNMLVSSNTIKEFYQNIPKTTRPFIEFTAKSYTLILEKMKENKHNSEILNHHDDADTYALFISSLYFDTGIKHFCSEYGVTLDKIFELIGFSFTEEEINNAKLDESILVSVYHRFIYDGINKNKQPSDISIDNISKNLCQKSFNQSSIIENIFGSINDEVILEDDFLEQLDHYLKLKAKKDLFNLREELFGELPVSSMLFLENVSIVHQFLQDKQDLWMANDLQVLTLLTTLSYTKEDSSDLFLSYLGFSSDLIFKFLSLGSFSDKKVFSNSANLYIIKEKYQDFIYKGYNEKKSRGELTIKNIASNAFNPKLNNTVTCNLLFDGVNKKYDDFSDFDGVYEQFLIDHHNKINSKKLKQMVSCYSDTTILFIEDVSKIHKCVAEQFELKTCNMEIIREMKDIEELSWLIAIFKYSNTKAVYFLKRNKLELKEILSYCKLEPNILEQIEKEEASVDTILNHYKKYIFYDGYNYEVEIDWLFKKILNNSINDSYILEDITAHCDGVYDILKEEIEKGTEIELKISKEKRIETLKNISIPPISLKDLSSIYRFSNQLVVHSDYFSNEGNRAIIDSNIDESLRIISDYLDKIKLQDELVPHKNQSLLGRFFLKKKEKEAIETKSILDEKFFLEIRNKINENINCLQTEIEEYKFNAQYATLFRDKNQLFLKTIQNAELEASESREDKYGSELIPFLDKQSLLAIIRQKINTLITTDITMQQEVAKQNQAIVNHLATINALKMTKNIIIPMIESEFLLSQGRNKQNQGFEISSRLVELGKNILDKNIDNTVSDMESLRNILGDKSSFLSINDGFIKFLETSKDINIQYAVESPDDFSKALGTVDSAPFQKKKK